MTTGPDGGSRSPVFTSNDLVLLWADIFGLGFGRFVDKGRLARMPSSAIVSIAFQQLQTVYSELAAEMTTENSLSAFTDDPEVVSGVAEPDELATNAPDAPVLVGRVDLASLPPELLSEIFGALAKSDKKRSLLNLMMACRMFYGEGHGHLLWTTHFMCFMEEHERLWDPWLAAADKDRRGDLVHNLTLASMGVAMGDRYFPVVFKCCQKVLSLGFWTNPSQLQRILPHMMPMANLVSLDIQRCRSYLPTSRLSAECDEWKGLELPHALRALTLRDTDLSNGILQIISRSSWISDLRFHWCDSVQSLSRFPDLVRKITRVSSKGFGEELDVWMDLPGFKPAYLELLWRNQRASANRIRFILWEGIEYLTLYAESALDLADGIPKVSKVFRVRFEIEATLPREQYESVGKKIAE